MTSVGQLKPWYVAQVFEASVVGVERGLRHLGFDTVRLTRWQRRRNKDPIELPVFPGYMFVAFNGGIENWPRSLDVPGFGSYLTMDGNLVPLPNGLIETLQNRTFDPDEYLGPPVAVGALIRLLNGPFQGFEGCCVSTHGDRLRLMVDLFGRPTELETDRRYAVPAL